MDFKNWIVTHKVASIVIAASATAVIATSVIVPVAVSNSKVEITWKNEDGSVLKVDKVKKGELPSYGEEVLTKASTTENTFTFAGWEPEVVKAKENAEYTAKFTSEIRKYTVTWKNENGAVLATNELPYGSTPVYSGVAPQKDTTQEHTYAWEGVWSPAITQVNGDASYTATFTENAHHYHVYWKEWDGTTLQEENDVAYNAIPDYTGATPSRDKTAEVTYTWNLWDSDIDVANSVITYTAHYDESKTKYTVKFVNDDDSVLETLNNIDYDADVRNQYPGAEEPVSTADSTLEFQFDGWTELDRDESNYIRTYKAQYTPIQTKASALKLELDDTDPANKFYKCKGYNGYSSSKTLIIPSHVDNIPIKVITANAFMWNSSLLTIEIPETVTTIEDSAFARINNVHTVLIHGSPNIGGYAFYNDNLLKNFTMEGDGAYTIGEYAFQNTIIESLENFGSGLTEIKEYAFKDGKIKSIPEFPNLVNIRGSAFNNNADLESVTFGSKLEKIYQRAFAYCPKLGDFSLPEGLTLLDDASFAYCTSITSIVIPDSLTSMGTGTFEGCSKLESFTYGLGLKSYSSSSFEGTGLKEFIVPAGHDTYKSVDGVLLNEDETDLIAFPAAKEGDYVIPDSVDYIAGYAFLGTTKLNSVTLSEKIKYIYGYTFSGSSVKSVITTDELLTINDYAFSDSGLESIHIGSKVSNISNNAFSGARSLSEITVDEGNLYYSSDAENFVLMNKGKTQIYHVASGKELASYTTPIGVTQISGWAFQYSKIESITLRDDVTSIGQNCFQYYDGAVTLSNNITTIPYECFGHSGITSITLPSKLTSINQWAFNDSKITSISLPDKCTYVGYNAFFGCEDLEEINLNKVETLIDNALAGSGVTEIVIPDTVTTMEHSVLSGCDKLESFTFNNTLTAVPYSTCYDCDALTSVTIPSQVTTIGHDAFNDCGSLTDISFAEGLVKIEQYAFYNCGKLENVSLPSTLKYLEYNAFRYIKASAINFAGTEAAWTANKENRHPNWGSFDVSHITHVKCSDSVGDGIAVGNGEY